MNIRNFLLTLLLLLALPAIGQQTKRVKATYTYHAPENVSLEEAKRTAVERAKVQAIAEAFGTWVTQSNVTLVKNTNGQGGTEFHSLGGSEVRGEWLETIGEPVYAISYAQGMLTVCVTLSGRIREIVQARVEFSARLLCNGTEERFERADFCHGDDLYLLFQSPAKGYLAVYLLDPSGTAFCLLPYRGQTSGNFAVRANHPYVLFSTRHADEKLRPLVDEYTMTCSGPQERNRLYIIFSPQPFIKAVDSNPDNTLPRELSYPDFQKWLTQCRKQDQKMSVEIKEIIVSNTNK